MVGGETEGKEEGAGRGVRELAGGRVDVEERKEDGGMKKTEKKLSKKKKQRWKGEIRRRKAAEGFCFHDAVLR